MSNDESRGEGWSAVANAWDQVFDALSDLGSEIAGTGKTAYESALSDADAAKMEVSGEPGAESPQEGESLTPQAAVEQDLTKELGQTVEKGIKGARAAWDASIEKLATTDKSESLSADVQKAMKVSLSQLATTFATLADSIDDPDSKTPSTVDKDASAPE